MRRAHAVCTTSTFPSRDQDLRDIYALERHEGILPKRHGGAA